MPTDRSETLAILKKLAPALATKDLIPVFSCFCFKEGVVFAYDDVVALQFPAEFSLRGAVRGGPVLAFLNASKTREVALSQTGNDVLIKCGRDKYTTTALEEDDFLFRPPNVKKAEEKELDLKLLAGISKASVSMGRDPSNPWRLGVTAVFCEGGVRLYASDSKTAVKVVVGKPEGSGTPVILHHRFVELLQDIHKGDTAVNLYLTKKWVEARFQSGLRLFARTISGADVSSFSQLFKDKPDSLIDLPKGFDRSLEKAMAVTPYAKDPLTRLKVEGKKLSFLTKSNVGDVSGSLIVGEGHDAVQAEFPPDLIYRGLTHATSFCVMESRMVLSGKGYTYLVCSANRGDDEEKKED